MNALEFARLAAACDFRPMTDDDFQAFAGAARGAQICANVPGHPQMVAIHSPAWQSDEEAIEFIESDDAGEFTSFALSLAQRG